MTIDKVIFKMLANIYLSRKFINTNFVTILMPLNRTRHNCDKFLWYKSCVLRINIYIYIWEHLHSKKVSTEMSILHPPGCWSIAHYYTHFSTVYIYIYMCVAVNIYIDFAPFPLLPTNQQPNVSANLLLLRCHWFCGAQRERSNGPCRYRPRNCSRALHPTSWRKTRPNQIPTREFHSHHRCLKLGWPKGCRFNLWCC